MSLTRILEERLANAWPALETQSCDGWSLRFAAGYSKRANAAAAILPGATLDDALLGHIVAQYRAQGLPTVFRLTGIEAPGTGDWLAERGFSDIEPSLGMTAALAGPAESDPAIAIEPAASTAWLADAAASYGGDKADSMRLAAIVTRIRQDAAFATLATEHGQAWGLAVAERGHVGLYDIVVSPQGRGRGLGRRLVTGLMGWGASRGAGTAYLQVRDTNAVAIALYGSLGFTTAYRYRHRVLA